MPSPDYEGMRVPSWRAAALRGAGPAEAWDRVGVAVLDASGAVIYSNLLAAELTGVSAPDLPALFSGRLGRLEDQEGTLLALTDFPGFAAAAADGWPHGIAARVRHENREPVRLLIDLVPLPEAGEKRRRLFLAVISELDGGDRELLTRTAEQAHVLAGISRQLASGVAGEEAVVDLVLQELAARDGELAVLLLLDPEGRGLRIAGAAHPDQALLEFFGDLRDRPAIPMGDGLADSVVVTGEPLLLEDLPGRRLLRYLLPEYRPPFKSAPRLRTLAGELLQLVIVPVVQGTETLGALMLGRWGQSPRYSREEVELLSAVAELTALALANARLHGEASGRLAVLEATRRVDQALAASVDERLTLDVILDQLVGHMGVDAAAVLALEDGQLRPVAGAGFRGARSREGMSHEPLYGDALELGRPVTVPAVDLAAWLRGVGLAGEGFQSAELRPLVTQGDAVGVLEVFTRGGESRNAEQRLGIEALVVRAGFALRALREAPAPGHRGLGLGRDRGRELEELSRAQLAVFRLLAEGASNREIASRLHISENTVKSHLREIFRKLGTRSRLQAAMKGAAWLRANAS